MEEDENLAFFDTWELKWIEAQQKLWVNSPKVKLKYLCLFEYEKLLFSEQQKFYKCCFHSAGSFKPLINIETTEEGGRRMVMKWRSGWFSTKGFLSPNSIKLFCDKFELPTIGELLRHCELMCS